jgi:hypothetical protein
MSFSQKYVMAHVGQSRLSSAFLSQRLGSRLFVRIARPLTAKNFSLQKQSFCSAIVLTMWQQQQAQYYAAPPPAQPPQQPPQQPQYYAPPAAQPALQTQYPQGSVQSSEAMIGIPSLPSFTICRPHAAFHQH